mgnify:CR=1 FL=1
MNPEEIIEQEIKHGTNCKTIVLLACASAKIAVMASAKEESLLADLLRTMWDELHDRAEGDRFLDLVKIVERVAGTTRWAPAKWFTAHSVLQAAKAVDLMNGDLVIDHRLFYSCVQRAVRLARIGIDPLISVDGDAQLVARMNEILQRERKAA